MFADSDEIAERHWKERVPGGREWVDTQRVLKARNQHGKSEQIKAAIREHEILLERRQNLPVFPRNLSICSSMVNFIDNAAPTVCSLDTRYLHASLTIKFTQSS